MAGYSGRSLISKLGVKPGSVLAVVNDPGHFRTLVDPLPDGVAIRRSLRGKAETAVLFVMSRSELRRRIGAAGRQVFPDGAVWIAWPKRSSGVLTDVTEDEVRAVVLPLGLVDVKVAAIDETWSGLRCVWRLENRTGASSQ